MRPSVVLLLAASCLLAGFVAGWGWRDADLNADLPGGETWLADADDRFTASAAAALLENAAGRGNAGAADMPGDSRIDVLFATGSYPDAVLALAARHRNDETGARLRLRAELAALVERADNVAAAQLADAILVYFARDPEVLLVQANVLQQLGQARTAVAPLYEVIHYAGSAAQADTARGRLNVLVDALVASMAQRGETGALLELLDELLAQDPDNHRWRLLAARWRYRAGEEAVARAHLDQLAPGVATDDAVRTSANELRLEMASGSAGLPLTRRGKHWIASVSVGGVAAELMVDTGASMTVLTPQLVRASGARALGRSVRVNTAGGTVAAALYEVDRLSAGPHAFSALTVAALPANLPADGLLGMDVLSQVGLDLAAEAPQTQ